MKPAAVTFDVGGIIYSDDVFKRAIFDALNQLTTPITQEDFDQVYFDHLASQSGSLRNKLCLKFLGSLDKKAELMQLATKLWRFTSADLYPDAKACITAFKSAGVKIGLVANQPATSADSLKADGILEHIDFLGISAIVGTLLGEEMGGLVRNLGLIFANSLWTFLIIPLFLPLIIKMRRIMLTSREK